MSSIKDTTLMPALQHLTNGILDEWLSLGLICTLNTAMGKVASTSQYIRLQKLTAEGLSTTTPISQKISLFPDDSEVRLGLDTSISRLLVSLDKEIAASNVIAQLLPRWIEIAEKHSTFEPSTICERLSLGPLEIVSRSPQLVNRITLAKKRIASQLNSRMTQFSRSAHYMGSKSALAPFLAEILHTFISPNTVVVDLMCGSGAAAGIFSRYWKTLASDAQKFSRLLAVVQGGGMTAERAENIAKHVLSVAREHYELLPTYIRDQVATEQQFLASELTPSVLHQLRDWITSYQRVGNVTAPTITWYDKLLNDRRNYPSTSPYVMFSAYYGNLFFGVRQAAEIDCLRYAIEKLTDPIEHSWALGALICASSSCAYTYGGHFAQPKLDFNRGTGINDYARAMLVQRGLSVSQEFYVRLTSLGSESESAPNVVESIEGPWENTIFSTERLVKNAPVCVYIDPPYTRDEYSRFYHVLETLVRYDYPRVHGKPSIPKRGEPGRFASQFFTRNQYQAEAIIQNMIDRCLKKGWSCLWSYSDSGMARIDSVLNGLESPIDAIELFSMNHAYKAQGRQKAKTVKEYAVFISPKMRA